MTLGKVRSVGSYYTAAAAFPVTGGDRQAVVTKVNRPQHNWSTGCVRSDQSLVDVALVEFKFRILLHEPFLFTNKITHT